VAHALSAGQMHETSAGATHEPKQSAHPVGVMQTSPLGHVKPAKPAQCVEGPQKPPVEPS
jgi:hypothetical protein